MDDDNEPLAQPAYVGDPRRRDFLWMALTEREAIGAIVLPMVMFNLGCLWQAHYGASVWLCAATTVGGYLAFLVVAGGLRALPRRSRA